MSTSRERKGSRTVTLGDTISVAVHWNSVTINYVQHYLKQKPKIRDCVRRQFNELTILYTEGEGEFVNFCACKRGRDGEVPTRSGTPLPFLVHTEAHIC